MEDGTTNSTIDRYAKVKKGSWFNQFWYGSNPWMARYVYGLMFLVATLLAWAVRDYGHTALKEMESKICSFFIQMPSYLKIEYSVCHNQEHLQRLEPNFHSQIHFWPAIVLFCHDVLAKLVQ